MRPIAEDHGAKQANQGQGLTKTSLQLTLSRHQFQHQESGDPNSILLGYVGWPVKDGLNT